MKPGAVILILCAAFGVSIALHAIQYGRIGALEAKQKRFEKVATRALTNNLVLLEKTLMHQRVLEKLFLQSRELHLTLEQLQNYNAKTKPRNYNTEQGENNAKTKKLLRAQSVQRGSKLGTGAWEEALPVYPSAP